MPPPKTYNTEAIVLKHSDLGEADRILTLYTPNHGKVRAVARGVRRTKSKLGGHVEPLTKCSLMLSHGRNLDVVCQGQTLESFSSLRSDLLLMAEALYLVELTDSFTSERAENYQVYRLLLECLHSIGRVRDVDVLFRYFELQLLGYMGYQPQLYKCLNCHVIIEPVDNFFSTSAGGILCPACAHTELIVQSLSVNGLKVLRLLQRGDYATANRLTLTADDSRELERVVQGCIRYVLEREVRSTAFIDRLKRESLRSEIA